MTPLDLQRIQRIVRSVAQHSHSAHILLREAEALLIAEEERTRRADKQRKVKRK